MCRRTGAAVVWLVSVVAFLGGCGGVDDDPSAARKTAGGTVSPAPTPSGSPVTRVVSPVDRLFGVGDARQVIAVIADDAEATTAVLTAYERSGDGWTQVFGPWTANIGAKGFAPAGEKREGDERTPTGAFGFDFAFGVLADPGVQLEYRRIGSDAIVWDDDPASGRYNQWVDTSTHSAGEDPEPMFNQPAYNYGVVIAYNTDRTPGLGSAIFLHVAKDGPTAGCVAIPQDDLVQLIRWLDPEKQPRIVMGTEGSVAP